MFIANDIGLFFLSARAEVVSALADIDVVVDSFYKHCAPNGA